MLVWSLKDLQSYLVSAVPAGFLATSMHTASMVFMADRLPIAQGVKMANRELTVIASGGDGDGFAIGMGHTVHAIRRNIDVTYIVMDNQIYGLTKGQTSPRSAEGFKTKATPEGSIEYGDITTGDCYVCWCNFRRSIVLQ